MLRRVIVLLCTVAVCLGVLSCQKLPSSVSQAGLLRGEVLSSLDAIPMEYGSLVSVTSDNAYPNWAQLWFEKPDKTVVMVKVNWVEGAVQKSVMLIPRR